jgi:hypothetical protein
VIRDRHPVAVVRYSSAECGEDDILLDSIARGFFGYGDLMGRLWFVGYEEHCADIEDARRRLPVLGTLVDAIDVFEAHRQWGMVAPKNKSTWPEMQAIMAAAGLGTAHVGTKGSGTFLTELLPFPHAGVRDYYRNLYGAFAADRRTYERRLLPLRCQTVGEKVRQHRPHVVIVHRRRKGEELARALAGPGSIEILGLGGRKVVDIARRQATTWIVTPNLSGAAAWSTAERQGLRRLVATEFSRASTRPSPVPGS